MVAVRSFGTEDRPTERPVPAKDECYEFIIFRGTDIKTIHVLEPPRSRFTSTPHCGLLQDPAIVTVIRAVDVDAAVGVTTGTTGAMATATVTVTPDNFATTADQFKWCVDNDNSAPFLSYRR